MMNGAAPLMALERRCSSSGSSRGEAGCIDLHKMVGKDGEGQFHSHPAWALRIVLFGGYIEELQDGRHKVWGPGMIGIVSPDKVHRIAGLINGKFSFSLWIRGKKKKDAKMIGKGWTS